MRRIRIASTVCAMAVAGTALGACTVQGSGDAAQPLRVHRTTAAPPAARPPAKAPSPSAPSSSAPAPSKDPEAARATVRPSHSPTRPAPPPPLMAVGTSSAQVRELQARLRSLKLFGQNPTGYYGTITSASVSAFQKSRGLPRTGSTDRTTWQRLLDRTDTPSHDELYPPTTLPVSKPDPRCTTGRAMCISKKSRTLAWMVDGKIVSAMDVRFGSEGDPTREGLFKVFWKHRHHVSTLYDSPMPYAMFFSGGEAVHYSSDFAARGYAGASHGCVNVRDEKKIAALYAAVHTGDKVVVY
ncbi:L,D-transpeptidase family protein [Streptomyces sp. NPDC050560]|uniref:L,D-transpeptidase family protein n=1 Tax=Streptomyces sp. NPDC050560 TaxID=3365630 RepID=UPI00378FBCF2